ncbi:hypothetical protein LCGC14_2331970 [marine sediment metagenome]|uniref:HTH IS21-type domain-containing protein n=1 Tax=marine sediment metagenome TaxID=412755 RepID=A0A0F9ESC2_9ZZZZ
MYVVVVISWTQRLKSDPPLTENLVVLGTNLELPEERMLRMDQVYVIRHKVLREGLSIRAVARQMGVSRNTVRKYLNISEPERRQMEPREKPVMKTVAPRIEGLLEEWKSRTTEKQRITGSRVHRQLVEE